MKISPIRQSDWKEFRDIRLAALQESPYAFGGTFEEESTLKDEEWMNLARFYEEDEGTLFLICYEGLDPVAIAGGYKNKKKEGVTQIYSVWLRPDIRGSEVASLLMKRIHDWSETEGRLILEGYVTENNERARAFYRKCGFRETDERIKLRWDNSIEEILIQKSINANKAQLTTCASARREC